MGDSSNLDGATALAVLLILGPVLLLLAAAGYVISSFFFMKLFDKAGVQGRWRAWVPVYNLLVFAKLGDLSPWVMLGAIVASTLLGEVPVIGWLLRLALLAAVVMASWRVGLKAGKDWPWLLLYLIPGIGGLIWLGVVALGHSRLNPAIAPSPWNTTFLADKTVWNGIPVQPSQPVSAAGGVPNAGYGAPQNPGGYPPPPATGTTPPAGSYPPPPAGGATPPPPSPGTTPPPPPQY